MHSRRCSVVDSSREFGHESRVLTNVESSIPSQEFLPELRVLTHIRSSDPSREFRLDSKKHNKCLDLVFEILIRTVPNSWETWKTRSIPCALLRELRISELCSMMMQTILICIADMDITVAMCAIGF